jgi:hypothetical protein
MVDTMKTCIVPWIGTGYTIFISILAWLNQEAGALCHVNMEEYGVYLMVF